MSLLLALRMLSVLSVLHEEVPIRIEVSATRYRLESGICIDRFYLRTGYVVLSLCNICATWVVMIYVHCTGMYVQSWISFLHFLGVFLVCHRLF